MEPKTRGSEDEEIYESWASPRYAVKRHYNARHEDELTLREGELVEVIKKMKDGGLTIVSAAVLVKSMVRTREHALLKLWALAFYIMIVNL